MKNTMTKIIFTIFLGLNLNNITYAQTSGSGAVCVSQSEFTNAVLVCTAATLGAAGASFTVLSGASCTTCFTVPTPITCGICGALTIFGGTAVYLATQTCQPPEMEVCDSPPPTPPSDGGSGSGSGGGSGGGGSGWDPGFGGGAYGGIGGGSACPGGTTEIPDGGGVICHQN